MSGTVTNILLVIICGCLCSVFCDEELCHDPSDFRRISYNDLMSQVNVFQHNDIEGYVQLTLDDERNQLLLGARDSLFRLSLDDISQIEMARWMPSDPQTCMFKGQAKDDCHNFVRVLLLHEDMVFTCGTNAFNPICQWRLADNLSEVNQSIDGRAKSPFNPYHNATALITKNGDLYTATVVDFAATDPSISRNLGPSKHLRTVRSNSKWLNEPNFISTYEIEGFIYFFFRETAVEFINCGKKIYSRVARVCKSDNGGKFLLEDNWTSFLKARMNCSIPGDFPFYYDELQSTYYSEQEELIYAIFTTPPNSIAGSAVCVYNMTAFQTAFTGSFKYQENAKSAWMKHDNSKPMERCPSHGSNSKRSPEMDGEPLVLAQQYQLMNLAVQPVDQEPLIHNDNERWTHIVVDHVIGKQGLHDVIFLATEDGKILKKMRLKEDYMNITCLIEEIKIVPNGEKRPVKAMKLSPDKGAIYISTNKKIIKIPVNRCSRFTDEDACVYAMDPYCGWNRLSRTCGPPPEGNPHAQNWIQFISSCPNIKYPVNGNWSSWSDWDKCQHVTSDGEECMCRSRQCNNPSPLYGGRPCSGPSVEVSNCTVHGQWTEWSSWSSCSQSCGFAIKQRSRHCGNPTPKYGGRGCMGENEEEQYCENVPSCPVPPVNGIWSMWSGWSQCTAKCNGGIQTRRRACDNPPPSYAGVPCIGNLKDWRMCNAQTCKEYAKKTKWTPWIQTNRTRGGYIEQRFSFTCRASVPDENMIKSDFAKSQARVCIDGKKECYKPKDLRSTISSMDAYSAVDRVLKKYCRFRRKLFKKYCSCRTLGVFLVCQKCGYG
ncbi:hypothetical protein SNE40_010402 [Patella caerulea]|uniref:Semaphorin-2A n=2 Tax=Patella caerulea TaxID=87958 RepID=A0AAN8Q4T9_PATCE